MIEIDGKQYAQTQALLVWAGKQSGLYPADALQALKVEEALGLLTDVQQKLVATFPEQDPVKRQELRKVYAETEVPKWFGYAEKLLEAEGKGYFSGDVRR